jgi:hypothetical protein
MAFKTKAQIFGDDAGAGAKVPVSEANPSGTAAANRGVQFGEQVTAAVANRPSYALADNTDDLNGRLGTLETGGLDGAYRLGSGMVAGGGREVTLDGGAIQTNSAFATQREGDVANAHFRAQQSANAINGGVGFDSVGYGRAGVGNPLASILDRRVITPSTSATTLAATVSVTLNAGGSDADSVTLLVGFFKDGGNVTELLLGFDLVEILSGDEAGLYVISALDTTTKATLKNLDGSAPSFGANTGSTARFFRPVSSIAARYGSDGTHLHGAATFSGLPGQQRAVALVPGSRNGRFGTASDTDGARMALSLLRRASDGSTTEVVGLDSLGNLKSTTSVAALPTALVPYAAEFGNPAVLVDQPGASGAELGLVARSVGTLDDYYGVLTGVDKRTTGEADGVAAFTFLAANVLDVPGSDLANFHMIPGISLVEILTPAAQAGIYRVTTLTSGDTEITLAPLLGGALSLPSSGAGTLRVLATVSAGRRKMLIDENSLFGALATNGSSSLVAEAGGGAEDTALALGSSASQMLLRGFYADDGVAREVVRLTGIGALWLDNSLNADGVNLLGASTEFTYTTPRTRTLVIPLLGATPEGGTSVGWELEGSFGLVAGYPRWKSLQNSSYLTLPLNSILRTDMKIQSIEILVQMGASHPTQIERMRALLCSVAVDFTSPYAAATKVHIADEYCADSLALQEIAGGTFSGINHTVDLATNEYWLTIRSSTTGAGTPDTIMGVRITVTDSTVRNT